MPTLDNDRISFNFPHLEDATTLEIDLHRTLRIPDSGKTYPLPPGLGLFPLRHVEDFSDSLPEATRSRGGIMLPMWQAEALWLSFKNSKMSGLFELDGPKTPFAVKIAAGKIDAVSGEPWRNGLHRDPQDYMVSPDQPWLDGFAIEPGVIRQFVAMPLGEGYSVEEQLTDEAEWGGLQISVTPIKADRWNEIKTEWQSRQSELRMNDASVVHDMVCMSMDETMGLAAGGRMRQVIHPDPYDFDIWDPSNTQRLFVTLADASRWKSLTGEDAPNHPPSAADYSRAGLPWFDFYGVDQEALPGGDRLRQATSLGKMYQNKTGVELPHSSDVDTGKPINLSLKGLRQMDTPEGWSQE